MDPTSLKTAEGRSAWLQARRRGLGSSDAAPILGLSPWRTPLHVYLDKVGELEDEDSIPKESGRMLEDTIALKYLEETGCPAYFPPRALLQHQQHPWMLASLDRMAVRESTARIVELKLVLNEVPGDWGTPGTDEIPDFYNVQVQHQMAVSGLPVADVGAWAPGKWFRVYTVAANERIIQTLITVEGDFWGQVQRREPPGVDWEHPRTLELLKDLYGCDSTLTVELGEEALKWAKLYILARQEIAGIEAQRCEALAHLLDLMGHAGVARLPQGYLLTRKTVKRKGYEVQPTEYKTFNVKAPRE